MNPKTTWMWTVVAVALAALIVIHERQNRLSQTGPVRILPDLQAAMVTSVQVQLKGPLTICAERTNNTWQLTKPVAYHAQSANIESLLEVLERLTPTATITARERQNRQNADVEDGLVPPQATIVIRQGSRLLQLDVGGKTPPGDQVYLRLVAGTDVYVADAELLKFIPHGRDDWRDTTLIDLRGLKYDRMVVTNSSNKCLELRHELAGDPWRIVNPPIEAPPNQARADSARIEHLLEGLGTLSIKQFVTDETNADLEAFGLQPPRLDLALARGTNLLARLQFGKSPTNDPGQVYARRFGQSAIVTVPADSLALWQDPVENFRDPLVIELPESVSAIEVHREDDFTLEHQGGDQWRVMPQNLRADTNAVREMLATLGRMAFVADKDAVIPAELAACGLTNKRPNYVIKTPCSSVPGATNRVYASLLFGLGQGNKVWVRRDNESSIYEVRPEDYQRLPASSSQLHERRVWSYTGQDIVGATITERGKTWQLTHGGRELVIGWTNASVPGVMEPLTVGVTLGALARLTVTNWVGCGNQCRARYGLTNRCQITLLTAKGDKPSIEIGCAAPPESAFGAVNLDDGLWVFKLDPRLYECIQLYLCAPP